MQFKVSKSLTMNYSVCTVISACTHPCYTNTLTYSLTRIHLLQLKIHNIRMKFFKSKNFPFRHKRNFNAEVTRIIFSIKLSANISDNSFLLDSLSKAKIFPNFSAGNSFLFFKRFWNVRLSDRCHFISYCKFSCLKKVNIIIFNFSVLSVFDKS